MARTLLTVSEVSDAGLIQPAEQNSDVTNGNYLAAEQFERLWIECRNSGGTTRTLTLVTGATYEGKAVDNVPHSIAAGVTRVIAALTTTLYGQPVGASQGQLWIDPEHTDLKYRIYRRANL